MGLINMTTQLHSRLHPVRTNRIWTRTGRPIIKIQLTDDEIYNTIPDPGTDHPITCRCRLYHS